MCLLATTLCKSIQKVCSLHRCSASLQELFIHWGRIVCNRVFFYFFHYTMITYFSSSHLKSYMPFATPALSSSSHKTGSGRVQLVKRASFGTQYLYRNPWTAIFHSITESPHLPALTSPTKTAMPFPNCSSSFSGTMAVWKGTVLVS